MIDNLLDGITHIYQTIYNRAERRHEDRTRQGDMLALITIREAATKIAQAFGTILNLLNLQACIVGVSRAGEHPSRSDTKRSMAQRPLRHRFVGSTESGEKGVRIRSFRRVCRKPIHLLFDQEEVSRLTSQKRGLVGLVVEAFVRGIPCFHICTRGRSGRRSGDQFPPRSPLRL